MRLNPKTPMTGVGPNERRKLPQDVIKSAWKREGKKGKVPVKFQRAAFVRHQASEGVIRRPFDTGYGCGCEKKRMTGSGNGAPCYWETRLVNEAGDLDLRVSLFPGHKGTILPRFPWAASQFIPLAPTSGLFNPTTDLHPHRPSLSCLCNVSSFPSPE